MALNAVIPMITYFNPVLTYYIIMPTSCSSSRVVGFPPPAEMASLATLIASAHQQDGDDNKEEKEEGDRLALSDNTLAALSSKLAHFAGRAD